MSDADPGGDTPTELSEPPADSDRSANTPESPEPASDPADAAADTDRIAPERPSHPRWLLPVIGVSIVALVLANNAGNAMFASLIHEKPYALLALNSSNKYILGTTTNTALILVLVLSTVRLVAPDPLFWMIGYLYRDRAEHWARRVFPGMNKVFDQFDQDKGGFARTLDVLLVVMPNNPVCLLAGVAGMRFRRMMTLSIVGTAGRILVLRGIGTLFDDEIDSILETISEYQSLLQKISIVLVVAFLAWQFFGRRGLIGGVEELEEELGD